MTPQNRAILRSLAAGIHRIGRDKNTTPFQRDKLTIAIGSIELAMNDKEQPCEQTKNKFHDGRPDPI